MTSIQLELIFMHGLGNRFIVIDISNGQNRLRKNQITPLLLKKILNHSKDYQIDQILFLDDSTHKQADFDYLIFNQDGSIAEQCANGARCISKYIYDTRESNHHLLHLLNGSLLEIEYFNDKKISALLNEENYSTKAIGLDLKNTTIETKQKYYYSYSLNLKNRAEVSQNKKIHFYALSVGNPHMVINVNELKFIGYPKISFEALNIESIAQFFQQEKNLFNNGVNVNFIEINSRNKIKLRTYERGAGETLACGSGACACFAALDTNELIDNELMIKLSLGNLLVKRVTDGSKTLETSENKIQIQGPAEFQEKILVSIDI